MNRMTSDKIVNIIVNYIHGIITDDERLELEEWLKTEGNKQIFEEIIDVDTISSRTIFFDSISKKTAWKNIKRKIAPSKYRTLSIASIAALFAVGLIASFLLYKNNEVQEIHIEPGVETAKIIIDGGDVLNLTRDSSYNINIPNVIMINNVNGVMKIDKPKVCSDELKWNEIITPKGADYKVVLSDGTIVHLNSESSLKIPSFFTNNCREVYAKGELYFEVKENESKPFIVNLGENYKIIVRGTEFNVCDYTDITTTLVKGKVDIQYKTQKIRLKPSEQAILDETDSILVRKVNVNLYKSWKDRLFVFENASLEEIMNDMERWYNIKIFYEKESLKHLRFSIEINKNKNFKEVMNLLSETRTISIMVNNRNVTIKRNNK